MAPMTRFPEFKWFALDDRDVIHPLLYRYQPRASELTFTNLYIWRDHYAYRWALLDEWLVVIGEDESGGTFALPPVGPPPRDAVVHRVLGWLRSAAEGKPRIERADQRLVDELGEDSDLLIRATRDQYDYVYHAAQLISLEGRKLYRKRNHIHRFQRTYDFQYDALKDQYVAPCLDLTEAWCDLRRCEEDMNLMDEWDAVREALTHWRELQIVGGVLLVGGRVEAFSLGERLNDETAVVHIEKANPDLQGAYAMINQQFCEHAWSALRYVNREQDLGIEGLRRAKLSYQPDHLVEKYRIELAPEGKGR
jgi:hypothetical protein